MSASGVRSRTYSGLVCLVLLVTSGAQYQPDNSDLFVHEWGTFTSVAGIGGRAVKWSTLQGSTRLPNFVEHLSGPSFKNGLRGTVRMETPVIYFYSPQETTVSVSVSFSKGVITEWYPGASRVTPDPNTVLDRDVLYAKRKDGSIVWDSVTVSPDLIPKFPHGRGGSQYYAARETAAAPLVVKTASGENQERFLFYRGVSSFSVPISATVAVNGDVQVRNLSQDEIPAVIRFERRGDKIGYRRVWPVHEEIFFENPEMNSTLDSVTRDLQAVLMGVGLYPDEAHAMIETWKQSWFEEGSRLFYIVPRRFLETVLPLTVNPTPMQSVRVFVGRVELVTPATEQAVANILANHDLEGLQRYARFLEPILDAMKAEKPDRSEQLEKDLDLTYRSPTNQARAAN